MDNLELFKIIENAFFVNGVMHKRYVHTIGVIEMALTLNRKHNLNLDEKDIMIAAGMHDITKLMPKDEMEIILKENFESEFEELEPFNDVWHGYVASVYVKKHYGITNENILNAIKYHTTGKVAMNNLEKLIFVSDYIEKNTRTNESMIKTREVAFQNLDMAVVKTLEDTIEYLKNNNKPIYSKTLETYNYYLSKGKCDV